MFHQNNARSRTAVGRIKVGIALTLAALAAGGCREYLDRSDTITLGVADATDNNKAVQTITRWPEAARHDRWQSDGERARIAIERYRQRNVTEPNTLETKPADSAPTASGAGGK